MAIIIRPVHTVAEYHRCEEIQRQVWAMSEDLEVVPLHLLITAHKNGGLLLGAFDGDDLVGFVFGFIGMTAEGRVKHCSHMMGVLPDVQSSGVGYQLKMAQREFVLAQGLDLITWTYDPLESRNAHLNVAKLGAVGRAYVRDLYGPMADGLNAGLPSDRFEMEWWISSERVKRRIASGSAESVAEPIPQAHVAHATATGFPAPGTPLLKTDAPTVGIEVPGDYQAVKAANAELARVWRLTTRKIFEFYFAAGYAVTDFVSHRVDGIRRSTYIVRRSSE